MNSSRKRAGDEAPPRLATPIAVITKPLELEACDTQRGARSHGTTVRQATPQRIPRTISAATTRAWSCGTSGSASMTPTESAPARYSMPASLPARSRSSGSSSAPRFQRPLRRGLSTGEVLRSSPGACIPMVQTMRASRIAALTTMATLLLAGVAAAQDNYAAAQADAGALLQSALLPDGAQALSEEPAGDGGVLAASPMPISSFNAVIGTKWFRVPSPARDVIGFLESHTPSGARPSVNGSADARDRGLDFRGFDRPAVRGQLTMRRLLLSVARLDDGSTGVRVDAIVVYAIPRPEASKIHGARYLMIRVGTRHIVITDPARVQRYAHLVNRADFQTQTRSCPSMPAKEPAHPRLSFRTRRGGRLLGYAHIRPSGCARADLAVGGKRFLGIDLLGGSGAKLLDALRGLGALPREAAAKQGA